MKAILAAAIVMPALVLAQMQTVPQKLGYQDRLLDDKGLPVTGPVDITFAIYGEETPSPATSAKWFETKRYSLSTASTPSSSAPSPSRRISSTARICGWR